MSLKRKDLSAMGIEPDKIDAIIEGHSETVNALQDEISELKEQLAAGEKVAKDLKSAQKEIADMKKAIAAEAKEREGKDYDKLLKEYEAYKADVENKAVRAAKESAYKEILKDANVPEQHWGKVLKYSDVDGVELDDNGKITTAKEIMQYLKDEWNGYIETTKVTGAKTETPPANQGGGMTIEQIDAIEDTAARQKAILENHELYGF